ncbi:uncharacterized protein TRIADDRAFT_60041 [Trichoplax adhaerens]|uniref:Dystroglycan 1 n=1 Tax=Trichoplax adhaerens TaxID=10228 RepID=B3S750_TRIAD|nr:hypothetical protein TRIADDRAFT_60041 [Trichoplax adhaerens]EDV21419.1 hypothetical protein TRIADDRAFT_60041 [Trichoplax adhaerens]|eukprot:XP_002116019.1 hypothetical protein TRIADDRAFT_60041 [Trichoplax adhaerens]
MTRTKWGTTNEMLINGKVFNYTIPNNTFDQQETATRYEVSDYNSGSSTLPSWLLFDQSAGRFTGFPTSGDEGSYRYRIVAISMQGTTNQLTAETEVTIIVSNGALPLRKISYIERENNACPRSEKVRVVNIVLQMNVPGLTGQARISLIEKLASRYQLHRSRVYLHHGDKGVPIIGQSYIEASTSGSSNTLKGTVSWVIGCENVMTGSQYGITIRKHIADGTFSQTVGNSIVGYNFVLGVPVEDAVSATASSGSSSSTTTISYSLRATPLVTVGLPSSSAVKSSYMLTPVPSQSLPKASSIVTSSVTITTSVNQQITATPTSPTTDVSIAPTTTTQEKPKVDNPIGTIVLRAGFIYRFSIPVNTFSDKEDGNTRQLSLNLFYANNSAVSQWSWLQLDKIRQQLYGLPMTSNVGRHLYQLEASDSRNQMVRDPIEVTVQRTEPPKLILQLLLEVTYDRFATDLALRIAVMEDISRIVGDRNVMLQLDDFRYDGFRSTRVRYSNYTLNAKACDVNAYSSIIRKIESIKSVSSIEVYRALGVINCVPETSATPTVITDRQPTATSLPTNKPPVVMQSLGQLDAYAGRIFEFQIPADVFLDAEDGNTRNLSLALLTENAIAVKSWITLRGNRLIGLPLEGDAGIKRFLLRATDSRNAIGYDSFNIKVNPLPQQYNYIMSMLLDLNYDVFMANLTRRINLVTEIAKSFQESIVKNLCLRSITSGSVNISWTNVALDALPCNASIYESLSRNLSSLRSNPVFNTGAYPVTGNNIKPSAECSAVVTVTVPTVQPSVNWIGTVLPATLSACLFIILILIIFFMYRNGKLFGNKRNKSEKALKASGGSSSSLPNTGKIVRDDDDADDIPDRHNKSMGTNLNSILLMEDFNPDSPKPPQY